MEGDSGLVTATALESKSSINTVSLTVSSNLTSSSISCNNLTVNGTVINPNSIGSTGPQGPQGPTGSQGSTGPTGPQGIKGDQGNNGTNGVNGLQGIKGDQGIIGPTGPQGIKGDQGIAGTNGNVILPLNNTFTGTNTFNDISSTGFKSTKTNYSIAFSDSSYIGFQKLGTYLNTIIVGTQLATEITNNLNTAIMNITLEVGVWNLSYQTTIKGRGTSSPLIGDLIIGISNVNVTTSFGYAMNRLTSYGNYIFTPYACNGSVILNVSGANSVYNLIVYSVNSNDTIMTRPIETYLTATRIA